MARTRAQLIALIRAELHEPVDGRYYKDDPEMFGWLEDTIKEIATELKIVRKYISFKADDLNYYLGTRNGLRYYRLIDGFMCIDPNYGIKVNGIRRIPTSDAEIETMQQKALSKNLLENPNSNATITVDDYFSEQYSDLIMHYGVNMIVDSIGFADGRVFWLTPNPLESDNIEYGAITVPEALSGDTSVPKLLEQFEELLQIGTVKRAIQKKINDGLVPESADIRYEARWKRQMSTCFW